MLTGSCLCGAVRYEVKGELGPIVMCHCAQCRKANGTAFATNSPVKARDFHLLQGSEALAEFESTPGKFRVFCGRCGSPLYSRRAAAPDVLRLRIGTLDTPLDARPSAHIFVDSKAAWWEIDDDLPQHAERA
jgi:hypothetical protein